MENGPLIIYPGTHKLPFLKHGYPDWEKEGGVNRAYFEIMDEVLKKYKPLHPVCEAGDVILFHPHLAHGAMENKTLGYRKSITVHLASSRCFYIDITNTFHEVLA